MKHNDKDLQPKHPIGVVANRTGVSPDLLRAWERRYGAVVPQRTQTGRRLYTDLDIARVALLKKLISAGRRISDVAGLRSEELEALVAEDRGAAGGTRVQSHVGGFATDGQTHLSTAIDAVSNYDREALERTLAVAALTMSRTEMRRELIVPLLREIGSRWSHGTLRVAQEHLATAIVKSFIENLRSRNIDRGRPMIVMTTPTGQFHEMGALMAATVAEESGWDVTYLGANLPAKEIGDSAAALGARAVGLSVIYLEDKQTVMDEIRSIREQLDPDVAIIVGGRAASVIAAEIRESGGTPVENLDELREQLDLVREGNQR